jgi:hypothetical protein
MIQRPVVVAINRPRAVVFAFVASVEAAPQWQAEMTEVQRTTAAPLGVGTTYQVQRRHLGVWLAASPAITAYEPHTTLVVACRVGPVQIQERYAFQSVGESTRVTCCCTIPNSGPATRHLVNAQAAALSRLKEVLETPGPLGPGRRRLSAG